MKNNMIIIAIVAIVALAGLSLYAVSLNNNSTMMDGSEMTEVMGAITSTANINSSAYKEYSQLKGEDYDRLFISDMIEHHEGAVNMAKLALVNAKHQELKDMAADIMSAQVNEIEDMKSWRTQWGYSSSSRENMRDHSSAGMMDRGMMAESLRGLSGDTFDKKFIELMIEHHQSAIDMAVSGEMNAYHAEIKTLTKAIVKAQGSEITQLKQWQEDWNYTN